MKTVLVPFVLLLGVALGACKLGGDPPPTRFYNIEPAPLEEPAAQSADEGIRLRQVGAAAHLREPFAWSVPPNRVGTYKYLRWTEAPAAFLRRLMSHELYERRGVPRLETLRTPALDLELLAFEEVVQPGGSEARVAILVRMTAPTGASILDRTIETRRWIEADRSRTEEEGPNGEAIAAALIGALHEAVSLAGELCVESLPPRPEGDAPPAGQGNAQEDG